MRHPRWRLLATLLIGLFCIGLLAPAPAVEPPNQPAADLGKELARVLDRREYKPAHIGLLIVEEDSDKIVFELNADKLFAPASVTKLYSVAAALDRLGPDHRCTTHVRHTGKIEGDRLHGDLILVASGDLTMGGRTDSQGRIAFSNNDHTYAGFTGNAVLTEPDPLAGLHALARQVAARGIRRIAGEVLVDDRLFDKAESTGSGPVLVTPIYINDNLIDFEVSPGKVGEKASLRVRPITPDYTVENEVKTVQAGEPSRVTVTSPAERHFVIAGQIAAGSRPIVRIREVPEPTAFARMHFIEVLKRHGVHMEAMQAPGLRQAAALPPSRDVAALPSLARLESPPFSENAKLILKVSHNLHASTLPILLALTEGNRTLAAGLRAQRDQLRKIGVDVETISFGGGAGGARGDLVTPRATVQLLQAMRKRPCFHSYYDALPILGVDGTLATAVKPDSPARGQVRAKTGTYTVANTLNSQFVLTSKALAGYLTTASGKKLVFCFFVNNTHLRPGEDSSREGRALGELCEIVYRHVK